MEASTQRLPDNSACTLQHCTLSYCQLSMQSRHQIRAPPIQPRLLVKTVQQ